MDEKDLKAIANKLCEKAPEEMITLINHLEAEKSDSDPLIFNFVNACRESNFLGDECGE